MTERLVGQVRGKVAMFIGSTPNIGTSVTAFGAAVQLAEQSAASVGYICLNFKSSKLHRYVGQDDPPGGLDTIRADWRAGVLEESRLLQHCTTFRQLPRLQVLFGTIWRDQAEFYQPFEIRNLLEIARRAFDVTVVDVSAYWDNAGTICAAMDADERIVVTTPDLGHFQEDLRQGLVSMAALFGLTPQAFNIVMNHSAGRNRGENSRVSGAMVQGETGMKLIAEMGEHPSLRAWTNEGKLVDFCRSNVLFRKEVLPLAAYLRESLQLKPLIQEHRTPYAVRHRLWRLRPRWLHS